MPIYGWGCLSCKKQVEILRESADLYLDPPTAEEAAGATKPDEPACEHKWDRVITGNFHVTKGPGWKGAKGHWGKV